MKKAVSILVMIIMNILMISDAKACEMSYDEYKDIKMKYTRLYIEGLTNIKKSHKICKCSIRKCDRRGSSKIECDEETVKVDKEPIKITKNQENIEIVEGKSKSLGDLFEVKIWSIWSNCWRSRGYRW